MKKLTILFAAMACMALGLTSCQKEETSATTKFRATFEPTTGKCYYDAANNRMSWDDGEDPERIFIFSSRAESPDEWTTRYPFGLYDLSSMTDGVATFDWVISDYIDYGDYEVPSPYQTATSAFTASDAPFYALSKSFGENPNLFPYDAAVTGKAINASLMDYHYAGIMPMASYSTDMNLHFKHLCGVLLVDVFGIPGGYELSRVEVLSSKYLYGPCLITFDANGIPTCAIDYQQRANQDGQMTSCGITVPDYSCDTYPGTCLTAIPLLPDTYEDLELRFIFFDEDWQEYRVTRTMNEGGSITIQRAKIHTLSFNFTDSDFPW